jgi:hypothetical protein
MFSWDTVKAAANLENIEYPSRKLPRYFQTQRVGLGRPRALHTRTKIQEAWAVN